LQRPTHAASLQLFVPAFTGAERLLYRRSFELYSSLRDADRAGRKMRDRADRDQPTGDADRRWNHRLLSNARHDAGSAAAPQLRRNCRIVEQLQPESYAEVEGHDATVMTLDIRLVDLILRERVCQIRACGKRNTRRWDVLVGTQMITQLCL